MTTGDRPEPMFPSGGRKLVWLAIADLLTERILDGTYPAENRLPSEIALQQETGAASETIRQAIAELRNRGLIETVPGKGSFVLPPGERPPPVLPGHKSAAPGTRRLRARRPFQRLLAKL